MVLISQKIQGFMHALCACLLAGILGVKKSFDFIFTFFLRSPDLRAEAYDPVPTRLDDQLEDQIAGFLANPKKGLKVDCDAKKVNCKRFVVVLLFFVVFI